MGHTLFREVARDANELFERSVAGKNQISQRALNPLKRLRDKLDGLSFLDHRVQPMVEAMDNLFVRLQRPCDRQSLSRTDGDHFNFV